MLKKDGKSASVSTAENTREIIMRAAFEQIRRKGFRASGLNDILADTELTKGAFYHHFPNKLALGYAIVDEMIVEAIETVWLAPLADAGDPIDAIKNILRTVSMDADVVSVGCPLNNLSVEMATVDEPFRERIERAYEKWVLGIADALNRGQENATVTGDVDTRDAATFIVAAMAGSRGMAKNAKSSATLVRCQEHLARYLDSLRPDATT